jgi:hypothetical protein
MPELIKHAQAQGVRIGLVIGLSPQSPKDLAFGPQAATTASNFGWVHLPCPIGDLAALDRNFGVFHRLVVNFFDKGAGRAPAADKGSSTSTPNKVAVCVSSLYGGDVCGYMIARFLAEGFNMSGPAALAAVASAWGGLRSDALRTLLLRQLGAPPPPYAPHVASSKPSPSKTATGGTAAVRKKGPRRIKRRPRPKVPEFAARESAQPLGKRSKTSHTSSASTPNAGSGANAVRTPRNEAVAAVAFDVRRLEMESEVKAEQLRSAVLDLVNNTRGKSWGEAKRRRIPGPMPVNLARTSLSCLASNDFWVAEKSDGDRFLLYYSAREAQSYLIGRKFGFYKVPGGLMAHIFRREGGGGGDSLIDGEVVQETVTSPKTGLDSVRSAYLVFDAVALHGVRYAELPLSQRLEGIGKVVGEYRRYEAKYGADAEKECPFVVQSKTFYRKEHVAAMFAKIKRIPGTAGHAEYWYTERRSTGVRKNRNDGIIFTPEKGGYLQVQMPFFPRFFPCAPV